MQTGTLHTSDDSYSNTIYFVDYTPSWAYEALTEAVMDEFIRIDDLPNNTDIGTAVIDTDKEKVVEVTLEDWVVEEYSE